MGAVLIIFGANRKENAAASWEARRQSFPRSFFGCGESTVCETVCKKLSCKYLDKKIRPSMRKGAARFQGGIALRPPARNANAGQVSVDKELLAV